jgi:hypothetical protein
MKFEWLLLLTLCFSLVLNACAFDVLRVEQIPAELKTNTSCGKEFVLTQDIKSIAGSGYNRTIKKGTRWNCVGEISQGLVYKTKDQILTVEGSNIYEANIVVLDQKLVGYFLPVENSFSPIDKPETLMMKETITQ